MFAVTTGPLSSLQERDRKNFELDTFLSIYILKENIDVHQTVSDH